MSLTSAAQISFYASRARPFVTLECVDQARRSEELVLTLRRLSYPRTSLDGNRVVLNINSAGNETRETHSLIIREETPPEGDLAAPPALNWFEELERLVPAT